MAPIRVALIGLSATDGSQFGPGNWGVLAHLRPILQSPHYELAALCNSSVESAQASIQFHKLSDSVKAYGSPEDLANDDDIDLVAVSVNVGKHFLLTKPALLKHKTLLVEWPLGASLAESEELTQLAVSNGLKTAVGVQLRADPIIVKLKELLAKGSIGRITSSVAWGCSSVLPTDMWLDEAAYYYDMKSGGNEYYIYFGHFLDTFTHVLGKFDLDTVQSTLKTQISTSPAMSLKTGEIVHAALRKTAPDHTFVQGVLESGAVASLVFRKSAKPTDELGLRWLITGTEGEIELTMPEDHLQFGPHGRKLRLRKGKEAEAKEIDFFDPKEPEHLTKVDYPGTNSARMYEALVRENGQYASFESALETHKLLDKIARDAKFI